MNRMNAVAKAGFSSAAEVRAALSRATPSALQDWQTVRRLVAARYHVELPADESPSPAVWRLVALLGALSECELLEALGRRNV